MTEKKERGREKTGRKAEQRERITHGQRERERNDKRRKSKES